MNPCIKRELREGTLNLLRLHQGTNARKVISEVYAFFVLQCTVCGRKSKHKRMSQPDMESIFTKIIYEIFTVYTDYYGPRARNFKWPSMQRCQLPIYNLNLIKNGEDIFVFLTRKVFISVSLSISFIIT